MTVNDITNTQRNLLKWLALFTMFLDHVGLILEGYISEFILFRLIGRFSFLAFGFLMAFNLASRKLDTQRTVSYLLKLSIFGILAQYAYVFLIPGAGLNIYGQFVGFILVIFSFSRLTHLQTIQSQQEQLILAIKYTVLGGVGVILSYYSDYHLGGLSYCVACYFFVRYSPITKISRQLWFIGLVGVAFLANEAMMSAYYDTTIGFPMILAIVMSVYFILSPPQERNIPAWFNMGGRKPSKFQTYFFYAFYPLHLWLLAGVKMLLDNL
ncbi:MULTISPECIES: TraX family protein [Rodentibacter]|uniref:TraX protein n=1 Tax=Rodentibacter pneumotropicus TaxID=758 RepID=A0A4S2Q4K0_9PAST|nr:MULTISPECIES: TraX family protein [Rodentibacter]MCX2960972.1 conjugal transfer protein TraX [Rodentibacter heylii]THA11025.1 hypothetical protein D3M78_01140 [Rodentibacter pneumotropicus]